MDKRLYSLVTIAAVVAALAAPVALSLFLAQRQAQDQEENRALEYAQDVVHRSEGMLGQVQSGIARLEASRAPCTDADLDVMRKIDLASSYIQAIGRVDGDTIVCSSLANLAGEGLVLGPADLESTHGARVRFDVRFPFSGTTRFVVIEYHGIAAIIHKDLPIDASTTDPNVALALFWREGGRVAASRGTIRPEWIARLGDRDAASFHDDDHVVAVARSRKFLIGALAALPDDAVNRQAKRLARVLLPLGVLAGLLLATLITYVARRQQAMPSIIRAGLRHDEFFLQYQPIVELATGRWVGAEALIRWRRPGGEMVRPDIFIQAAEDSGQILQVTERVLALVARDAGDLFQRHPGFHIAINLSDADLHSPLTIQRLRRLAQATGAAPGNLLVEATERGFLDQAVAKEMVKQMRDGGFRVAVDDFGTGYSSLSYLQSLALDVLKIDKSFVDTIGAEAATSQVVAHIIEMAKDLHLEMVAEGVEQPAQADYLRERGVQFAQGWLFGRPMALPELLAKMPSP